MIPQLQELVGDPKARASNNTILTKEFGSGGVLVCTGANSAVGLRSMPVAIYLGMKFQHGLQIVGKVIPFPLAEKEPPPMPEEKYFFVVPQPSKAFAELKGNIRTAPRKSSLFPAHSASTSNPWNGKGLSGTKMKKGNTFLKLQNMNVSNVIN